MLINRINYTPQTNKTKSVGLRPNQRQISFRGSDVFEVKPCVFQGSLSSKELEDILSTIKQKDVKPLSSGFTSDIYKIDDKIIKIPKQEVLQSCNFKSGGGQNLKEYYILKQIENISPDVAAKPFGIIKDRNLFYLVEEFIKGKHPKGNRITKEQMQDLITKLAALDKNGIANCDLQSENIFLPDEKTIKLIDFGSFSFIDNFGNIVASDYVPAELFKEGGVIYKNTDKDARIRFLKAVLKNDFPDIKNNIDNPYLKLPSNMTNFEFRTLYSCLLDNSEENSLEFFKNYLKTKAEIYHANMKKFLEGLLEEEILKSANFSQVEMESIKTRLKQAASYESILKEVLSACDEDILKVELAKLQLRTFLNLDDSLGSKIENPKKLKATLEQLTTLLNAGIENSTGNKKKYFSQTLQGVMQTFSDFSFESGQVDIPEEENLIKLLFKTESDTASEPIKQTGSIIKKNNKKLTAILAVCAALIVVTFGFVFKNRNKNSNGSRLGKYV